MKDCTFIGEAMQSHNKRFNCHCADVAQDPHQFDLAQHNNENECNIRCDLEILVLEHVKGFSDCMKHLVKDNWIIRL